MSKQIERIGFRDTLRLGRRPISVYLENDKRPTEVWSNYSMSRDIARPVQRMPRVEHNSTPKKDQ